MTHIRDAVHGYIEIDEEEETVVDSPEMQRLRRVRQLGLSSLVYPSATHTRFQHSLGVMHLAGKFADSLELEEERKKELRIAGLLHDAGHGPFSHTSERVAEKRGIKHETLSCRVVEKLEDRFSADAGRVKDIIQGEAKLGSIVAGDIDADRMDYLVRDAHSSGLEHGNIDTATIIRLAGLDSGEVVFDQKAVQVLESLFTARFHMIRSLYKHHASMIADKMLQRAIENYLQEGNNLEEFMKLDDYEAHSALINSEGRSRRLYRRIKDRKLYKRSLVWDEDDIPREGLESLENRIKNPRDIEKEIAEEAGVEEEEVIIDRPNTPEIQQIDVKIRGEKEGRSLSEVSPIVNSLAEAEWRMVAMKVYTVEDSTGEVEEAAKDVLEDYTNVLSGYM